MASKRLNGNIFTHTIRSSPLRNYYDGFLGIHYYVKTIQNIIVFVNLILECH